MKGDEDEVSRLLDSGTPVDALFEGITTPLFIAAYRNRTRVMQLLLSRGANSDYEAPNGNTILITASGSDSFLEAVKLLLHNGADINKKNLRGETPLIWSALKDSKEVMKVLLSYGAIVDCQDNNERTPLMYVVAKGMLGRTQLLLQAGADASICNANGKNALDIAIERKNNALVELLRQAGAVESQKRN